MIATFMTRSSVLFFFLSFSTIYGRFGTESSSTEGDNIVPSVKLSNGKDFPLVGIGVGNLEHESIVPVISEGIREGYRLIDTARASQNENLVAQGIEKGMDYVNKNNNEDDKVVHVVTKVWYTHLGYNRTVLSVKESLSELLLPYSKNDVRVHVILHWPRCYDDVPWMDCEGEEAQLPQYIREAGPPPHLDKENAWKESWKALEDMYSDDQSNTTKIESIGVSNFDMDAMEQLLEICRIKPHLQQGNVWEAVHEPSFMELLHENGIHFQAYNVMNGIVQRQNAAPNAYETLEDIGESLAEDLGEDVSPFSVSQVVLAWLVQNNISVIPRASSLVHQKENSPRSIMKVPRFEEDENMEVSEAITALLQGEDYDSADDDENDGRVSATFVNTVGDTRTIFHLYWKDSETGEEVPVKDGLKPGEVFHTDTSPGHVFVAYDAAGSTRKEFEVKADSGGHEEFAMEL